jgi:hypothetical protein
MPERKVEDESAMALCDSRPDLSITWTWTNTSSKIKPAPVRHHRKRTVMASVAGRGLKQKT